MIPRNGLSAHLTLLLISAGNEKMPNHVPVGMKMLRKINEEMLGEDCSTTRVVNSGDSRSSTRNGNLSLRRETAKKEVPIPELYMIQQLTVGVSAVT